MNVAEIRQRIFDQMDYNPDLQQYRDSVVRRMNDQYQLISDSAQWLFFQTESELQLRKKVSGDGAKIGVYPVTSNPRKLRALAFTPTIEMCGQTLRDTAGNKFVIIRVQQDPSDSSIYYIYIEPESSGLNTGYSTAYSSGSPDYGFSITFDRYQMPSDCIETLGIVDRSSDRGRLLTIGRKREEKAYLDRDNTGEPSVTIDDDFVIDAAPNHPAPTLALSSSGSLTQLNEFEYKYTLLREGRESPPSRSSKITLTSGNQTVNLSGLEDTRWTDSGPAQRNSGIAKLVYRRNLTLDGPWMLVGVVESGTTTLVDNTKIPTDIGAYKVLPNYYYSSIDDVVLYNDPGPYQYMRFWYSPDTDRVVHLRYRRRPRDLQSDNDVPEWPRHYHQILVYKTLEDMFLQMQDIGQAQIFGARGMVLIDQMRKRYLARAETHKRFARFDSPQRQRKNYGTPSIE